jgi:hypothetical protein
VVAADGTAADGGGGWWRMIVAEAARLSPVLKTVPQIPKMHAFLCRCSHVHVHAFVFTFLYVYVCMCVGGCVCVGGGIRCVRLPD